MTEPRAENAFDTTDAVASDDGVADATGGRADETRAELERLTAEMARLAPRLPERLEAGPDDAERGLAQLVLTLVEFVRQLLEKQAVRRMEGGTLGDDEIERLGLTLLRLRDRMEELRHAFGLEAEDLMLRLDSTRGPG